MSQRTLKALALAAAGALAFTIVGVPAANGAATEVVDPVGYRSAGGGMQDPIRSGDRSVFATTATQYGTGPGAEHRRRACQL